MSNRGQLNAVASSNVGLVRNNNEDNYLLGHCLNEDSSDVSKSYMNLALGEWSCCAVFDGMGGTTLGEVASLKAAECFQNAFLSDISNYNEDDICELIENTFGEANRVVCGISENGDTCGTTGTVIATDGNRFKIFHVGDSRAYLFRNNELFLLTKDQTVAQMKIDIGVYTDKSQVKEKENHQLIEFIGCENESDMLIPLESSWKDLLEGDRLLICSDGLYDMCSDNIIFDVFRKNIGIDEMTDEFIKCAIENGGRDNVTVLVLERV